MIGAGYWEDELENSDSDVYISSRILSDTKKQIVNKQMHLFSNHFSPILEIFKF